MKTQTKVALVLGFVNVAIVALFGLAIYYFLDKYSYADFYKRLETRARIAARYNLELVELDAENLKSLREQHLEKLPGEREWIIELHSGISLPQVADSAKIPHELLVNTLAEGKGHVKTDNVFFTGIIHREGARRFLVVVSAENYYASHHLYYLRTLILGCIFFIVLLVVILSYYFSRHVFDPIKRITDKVKQISTESIHLRLESDLQMNELDELSSTFNDLLNRIETAFETQKNFISNASHELGTPLTAIIGEADVALMKDRTAEQYKSSLENILFHAGRLDEITKSLLFLAQTGYRGKAISMEITRVDELIWETKGLIDKLNPGNQIAVDLSLLPEDHRKLKVKGNRQLLNLAFANVLNNACKYSSNKVVTVCIGSSESHVIVTIADQGIGIPQTEMAFIYDPFFRASNTGMYEGYGIGLPLARNVVILHRGTLHVSSEVNKGTTVQIKLPLAILPQF